MTYAENARIVFTDTLAALERLVDKAGAAGVDDTLLGERLAEDMFPLETQFRIAVNQVRLALARTLEGDTPLDEEPYGTFAEVRARIAAARRLLDDAPAEQWVDAGTEIDMTLPNGMRFVMTAAEYVRDFTLPNLYFHAGMAYALLRRHGVELGKIDFIGHMARHARKSA